MKKILSFILALVMLSSAFALISSADEPFGVIVEAEYSETAPDMSAALPDSSWGDVTAHIDGNSPNAAIISYHKNAGTVRDDLSCDIYMKWDNENLYLCFVSADEDVRGSESHHTGDGILIDMVYGVMDMSHFNSELAEDSVTWRNNFSYSVTFANDNKTVDFDGASLSLKKSPVICYDKDEKKIVAKLEVPFTSLGLGKKETPHENDCISFSMCRIEGVAADGYLGWLEWGNYYDSTKETADSAANTAQIGIIELPETKTGNTIRLVKTSAEEQAEDITEPLPEQDESTPITLAEEPSSWAKDEVVWAVELGLVPTELQTGFTNGITRSQLALMLSSMLDKIGLELPAKEKKASFTDTTDENVLAAADLDLIKGYDNGDGTFMFKPANTLKRSEMTAIINRVAKLYGFKTEGYESEVGFTDTEKHWCRGELGWPVHNGIVKGTTATTFSPEKTLTVEQTIMMIYRTYVALVRK